VERYVASHDYRKVVEESGPVLVTLLIIKDIEYITERKRSPQRSAQPDGSHNCADNRYCNR
jgi:hypothetical protein